MAWRLVAVLEVVPNARMLSISAPEPLVLAGKRNPSRVQLFGHGLVDYLDDTWPGGVEGYGRWITDEERPLLITLGSAAIPSWLEPRLRETYVRVGRTPSWRWFVRRDAPQPVREGLRGALAAVPAVEG